MKGKIAAFQFETNAWDMGAVKWSAFQPGEEGIIANVQEALLSMDAS